MPAPFAIFKIHNRLAPNYLYENLQLTLTHLFYMVEKTQTPTIIYSLGHENTKTVFFPDLIKAWNNMGRNFNPAIRCQFLKIKSLV